MKNKRKNKNTGLHTQWHEEHIVLKIQQKVSSTVPYTAQKIFFTFLDLKGFPVKTVKVKGMELPHLMEIPLDLGRSLYSMADLDSRETAFKMRVSGVVPQRKTLKYT